MSRKNLIVGQSGGPTAVINSSLYGVVSEGMRHPEAIEHVYGMINGIEGFLNGTVLDFAEALPGEKLDGLKVTDNTQANTLLENANAHLSSQKQVFEGYGTDQMALLNNAVVGKKGNYVYYMCGADAQNWRTAFLSMI